MISLLACLLFIWRSAFLGGLCNFCVALVCTEAQENRIGMGVSAARFQQQSHVKLVSCLDQHSAGLGREFQEHGGFYLCLA